MFPLSHPDIDKILEKIENAHLIQPDPPRWDYPKKVKGDFILSAKPNQSIEYGASHEVKQHPE